MFCQNVGRVLAGWGSNFCFPRRRLCRRVASARQAHARYAYACFVGACPCAAQRRQDPCLERSRRRASPAASPPTRRSCVGRRPVLASRTARPHCLGRSAGIRCICAPPAPSQTRVPGPPAAEHPAHSGSAGSHLTDAYASMHDAAIARCVAALLDHAEGPLPQHSLHAAQLALRFGGLGLRSAEAERYATHWASWCDTLPVVRARAPAVADRLLQALQGNIPLPCAAPMRANTLLPRATMPPLGTSSLAPTQRLPPVLQGMSRATIFGVGNAMLPEPVMSARARRILLNCLPHTVRCCFHRPDPIRHGPRPAAPVGQAWLHCH